MLLDGTGREQETPLLAGNGRGITPMRLHRGPASTRQPGGARRLLLPRRTVRLRLTAMYGVLFFVCGALLLALADGVTVSRSSSVAAGSGTSGGPGSGQAGVPAQIQHLNGQPSVPAAGPSLSHQRTAAGPLVADNYTVEEQLAPPDAP